MNRFITLALAGSLLTVTSAHADHHKDKDFAPYSVNVGFSPFGGSLGFGYNANSKTTYQFALGGFSGEAPFKADVEGTEYTMETETTWVGFFVQHRPVDNARWFRLVAGLGIGSIETELDDGDGNTYDVHYKENPVGYLGLGFGGEAKKGFIWGFDLGVLQTSGPMIAKTGGMGADQSAEIGDNAFFGTVLPNLQVTLGWGF